jgi:hypothetical protein
MRGPLIPALVSSRPGKTAGDVLYGGEVRAVDAAGPSLEMQVQDGDGQRGTVVRRSRDEAEGRSWSGLESRAELKGMLPFSCKVRLSLHDLLWSRAA